MIRFFRAAAALAVWAVASACSPSAGPSDSSTDAERSEATQRAESSRAEAAGPEVQTINPNFWLEQSKLTAADGSPNAQFGYAVAVSGDTALVGDHGDDDFGTQSGSAHVFVRNGTTWTWRQKLLAADASSGDLFGRTVALSGDTALIGARGDATSRGAAYVFVRSGTTFAQQQKLLASNGRAQNYFGEAVALENDTAVIGSPGAGDLGISDGQAYFFVRSGSTWSEQQFVRASDATAPGLDRFGSSVAISGNTALIGANGFDVPGLPTGYVFVRSGTTWTQQQKLARAEDGRSVALHGDTAILGADLDSSTGAALVFTRSGTSWSFRQRLLPSDGMTSDYFGYSVALSEGTAVVGAIHNDNPNDEGAAYVFVRQGTSWVQQEKFTASDGATGAYFGNAVALSGRTALIGAPGTNNGSAYPFYFSDPFADGTPCPQGASFCASGFCRDGVCCNAACSSPCLRCDSNPGVCTPVTGTEDPDTCTGVNICDPAGACRLKTAQPCSAPSQCASGFCSDSYCCNTACSGGCDRCFVTPGTCTLENPGAPGTNLSCSPYVCTGTSGTCPNTCDADVDCAGGFYCSSAGTCLARKSQATACNDTAGQDCFVGGCRVCQGTSNGNCVDGYCCDTACMAPCDVCSAAIGQGPNGTCDTADEGYAPAACGSYACNGTVSTCSTTCAKDEHCAPSHYCAAGGTCQSRRAQGEACNDTGGQDCLVGGCRVCNTAGGCVDGFCCNAPCSGSCDVCSQTLGAFQNGLCGVAPATSPGNPSCAPYLCNGSAPSCASSCSSDNGCVQSAWCDAFDSRCKPDQQNGESCTLGSQCISGNCVDGFCCNDPCQGTCQACAALLKESGTGNGICGNAESGSDPHDDCAAEAAFTCRHDGLCDGVGRCRNHPRGTTCGTDNMCSGNSVTGAICNGDGMCDPNGVGQNCTPFVCVSGSGCAIPCAANNQCLTGYFCDNGECRLERANGQACVLESECASGFCIEGICCDTRCDGLCQSCRASEKTSGDEDGSCGPAAEGTDPHDDCTADDPASCDKDGTCDGSGECRLYAAGTECRDTACTGDEQNGFEVTAYECDGAGACDSTRQTVCGFYACADARCGSDCDDDTGCTLDAYCDSGECNSKTGLGTPCTLTSECQSGFCVDGVCCDGLCAGQCEACNLAGGEGRCTPVTGEPRGDRPACPEAPADEPCAQTECDGETRGECAGFPTGTLVCRPAECVDDENGSEARPASRCNGGGACEEASFVACVAYRCDGDVCGTGCDSSEDCVPGNICADDRCVSGATCSDDGLELIDDDGNSIPCRPYRCEGALCLDSCDTTADCAPGFSCNPGNQRCEEVAESATADDSGCGCRTGAGRDAHGAPALVVLIVASLLRRRRRRPALPGRSARAGESTPRCMLAGQGPIVLFVATLQGCGGQSVRAVDRDGPVGAGGKQGAGTSGNAGSEQGGSSPSHPADRGGTTQGGSGPGRGGSPATGGAGGDGGDMDTAGEAGAGGNDHECEVDACRNGGTCFEIAEGRACECRPGIFGASCEFLVTQIAVGQRQACALLANGSIECWAEDGDLFAPSGPFTFVAAGTSHFCALRPDGSAECWDGWGSTEVATPPSGAFTVLTAGNEHTCGLRVSGAAECWGDNRLGQSAPPSGPFSAIAAGLYHTCGLRGDGIVECWGDNRRDQSTPLPGFFAAMDAGGFDTCGLRGDGSIECWGSGAATTEAPPAGSFSQLTVGRGHACVLHDDGSVECWGSNELGEATPPAGAFVRLDAGGELSCGLRPDDSVNCWGSGSQGQASPPPSGYVAITMGSQHGCGILRDGTVECWGSNQRGQAQPPAGRFAALAAGDVNTCGLRADGVIECWGSNLYGESTPPAGSFTALGASLFDACALRTDGSAVCWGSHADDYPPPLDSFTALAVGFAHACGLRIDGSVLCWGDDHQGQLRAPSGSFVGVAAGGDHSCALREDGAALCWGYNWVGQASPPDETFETLAAGAYHTCGIKPDRTAACWGMDFEGQSSPPPGPFTMLALGSRHTCGIRSDGRLSCWGLGVY